MPLAPWTELPNGFKYRVTERRRYGRTTYTWVSFEHPDGSEARTVDPWPCVTPSRRSLLEESNRLAAERDFP